MQWDTLQHGITDNMSPRGLFFSAHTLENVSVHCVLPSTGCRKKRRSDCNPGYFERVRGPWFSEWEPPPRGRIRILLFDASDTLANSPSLATFRESQRTFEVLRGGKNGK